MKYKLFLLGILVFVGGVLIFTDIERVCKPQECLVDYDYYYCKPFRCEEPFMWNTTENNLYCKPYYPNQCEYGHCYPIECESIEIIDNEVICYPIEGACIRRFAGAYCPGEMCSYKISWINNFGGGLILLGLYLIHRSLNKEAKE